MPERIALLVLRIEWSDAGPRVSISSQLDLRDDAREYLRLEQQLPDAVAAVVGEWVGRVIGPNPPSEAGSTDS